MMHKSDHYSPQNVKRRAAKTYQLRRHAIVSEDIVEDFPRRRQIGVARRLLA
jgi:hypothetical protein